MVHISPSKPINDPSISSVPLTPAGGEEVTSKSSVSTESRVKQIGITTLKPADSTLVVKSHLTIENAVKVFFFPLTLLYYAISASLAKLASRQGLGTSDEVKSISPYKRDELHAMGGEDIQFGMQGGAVLEGMYFKGEPTTTPLKQKTILVCTGSHQSYEHYAISMVRELKSMGHHVMVFNYEGFGNSQGDVSEEGVYRSVEAAYQYLKQAKSCPDDAIVAWGYSLGSGAVSDLTTRHAVDVVIDRGFSSMSAVAYDRAPTGLKTVAKVAFQAGAHFNNLDKLTRAQGAVLAVQGRWDSTMLDEAHGLKLKQVLDQRPNTIYKEVNSGHFHSDTAVWFDSDPYRQDVQDFLNR